MWEVLVFGLIQLGQSPHRERDRLETRSRYRPMLKTLYGAAGERLVQHQFVVRCQSSRLFPLLDTNFGPYMVPRLGIRDCANAESLGRIT